MSEEETRPGTDTMVPTETPPRSWAELIQTLHGGLAVIDANWRLSFVSDRFFPFSGTPSDICGRDVRTLFRALDDDQRGLCDQVEIGAPVSFEQRFLGRHNSQRWFRVTVVPSSGLGEGVMAVVFTKETTATSSALALLREATLSLTQIEDQLNQRVARNVHDGPIQLLAALVLRLDLIDDPERTREIRDAARVLSDQLRDAVAELSHDSGPPSVGELLETWITPFLAGSQIDFQIEDHLKVRPTESAVHAAFVYIYAIVRAARHLGRTRHIHLSLADDGNGCRLDLTADHARESSLQIGRVAAQHRGLVDYTHLIGGTLATEINDGVRTVTVWIPRNTKPELMDTMVAVQSDESSLDHPGQRSWANTITSLAPLSDATWEEIASAAPERLLELDHSGRFSFANSAQEDMFGLAAAEILGRRFQDVFPPGTFDSLAPEVTKLEAGQPVDATYQLTNALGELRRVRFTVSPRLDEAGVWSGLLVAVDDVSDTQFHAQLWRGALADLATTRRLAVEKQLRRLEGPLLASEDLVEQLEEFETSTPDSEAFNAIRVALAESMSRVRRSRGVLEPPDLTTGDLGGAVRTSLELVLTGTKLVFIDESTDPLSTAMSEDLYRIAREAVVNGVVHGKADVVTMTLATDSGVALAIHDNGSGIGANDLEHKPGHLGTRAMSERARERGGTCRIEPDQRGGTLVSVWLPHQVDRSTPISFSPAER